jgi:hypothetical protein
MEAMRFRMGREWTDLCARNLNVGTKEDGPLEGLNKYDLGVATWARKSDKGVTSETLRVRVGEDTREFKPKADDFPEGPVGQVGGDVADEHHLSSHSELEGVLSGHGGVQGTGGRACVSGCKCLRGSG